MTAVTRALWQVEQRLPMETRHALMCRRRRVPWQRSGVIFVHVPKAAGSSVSHALYGRSLGHIPARAIRRHCPDLWRDLPRFAILRDPAERAFSAWRFARSGGSDLAGVSTGARRAVAGFAGFAEFVEGYLARADLARADPIFRPQVSFVCDGEAVLPRLFPLDRLDRAAEWVAERLGRRVAFAALNRSGAPETPLPAALSARIAAIYAADQRLFSEVRG